MQNNISASGSFLLLPATSSSLHFTCLNECSLEKTFRVKTCSEILFFVKRVAIHLQAATAVSLELIYAVKDER